MSGNDGSKEDKKNKSTAIKFDVFHSTTNHCFEQEQTDNKTVDIDIHQCDAIKRLLYALRYYGLLKIKAEASNHNICLLTEFCVNVYTELLNDYEHLMSIHSHQLQEINHQITANHQFGNKCTMDQCLMIQRHYGERRPRSVDHEESLFMFYRDTLDSAHHYLYHLYDMGLRMKQDEANPSVDNDESRMRNKRDNTGIRARVHKVNKFNITTTNEDSNDTDHKHADAPFLDSLFETIKKHTTEYIASLYAIIKDEEYDTDAMVDDIGADQSDDASNIANYVKNDAFIGALTQYIKNKKLHAVSFAKGITWFYWPYYKDIGLEEQLNQSMQTNINDYGGYSMKQLFVEQKYCDFKTEILVHVTMDQYTDYILLKAQKYLNTNKVKSIAANDYCKKGFLHYDITPSTPITIHHLISLILYCDLTEYCTLFSATFRQKSCFETLSSVKERNKEYWWMSKMLRETVELYGYGNRWYYRRQEMGPFFSGVDLLMHVPSFSIRLCSPTSTTKQLQVALRFAKEEGMIIQLNNNGHRRSDMLSMFDCSWISRYREEDERLFMGGYEKIRIESIRICHNGKWMHFEPYFRSLFILDSMVNGTRIKQIKITQRDVMIITKLLSSEVDKFPAYIQQCFQLFCKNKFQMIVNIHYLTQCFKEEISGFIVQSLKKTNTARNNVPKMESDVTSCDNLLVAALFKIFPNVREIHISTTSSGGGESYIFSMTKLLDIILAPTMPKWTLLTIQAIRNRGNNKIGDGDTWIHNLFCSSDIQSLYKKRNLQIDLKKKASSFQYAKEEDRLSIKRLKK